MDKAITLITLIVAVATLAATVFGIWFSNRHKQPFRLDKGQDGTAILTRTRAPEVQVLGVWLKGTGLITFGQSNRGAQFVNIAPDGWITLNVGDAPTGSAVEVHYHRLWPWRSHGPQPQHSEEKNDALIKSIDQTPKAWKKWGGPLL